MPRPVTSTTKGQGVAIAALIAATLFWAGNYVVGEIAVASIDPLSLSFLRWVIAAPVLLVVAAVLERPDWRAVLRALPRLAILGSLGMIGFVLPLYIALQTTTAVSASIIGAICPVLIAVNSIVIDQGDPVRGGLVAIVYSLGLGLPFIGIALGLGWATGSVAWIKRHIRAINIAGGAVLIAIGLAMVTGLWSLLMSQLTAVVNVFAPII